MDHGLIVVSTLFSLSLLGAFVLFYFLKATAVVKNKRYQAGGALAGFIVLYSALSGSHIYIEENDCQQIIHDYEEMEKYSQNTVIKGQVNPSKDVELILAVRRTNPDKSGKFKLTAPCLNFERDDVRLYVVDLASDENTFLSFWSKEEAQKEQEISLE